MMAIAQGFHRRFDYIRRRREIRLTNAEIDNVAPARSELVCPGQHGKGVFFPDMAETVNDA
jgi:hypothetical protein